MAPGGMARVVRYVSEWNYYDVRATDAEMRVRVLGCYRGDDPWGRGGPRIIERLLYDADGYLEKLVVVARQPRCPGAPDVQWGDDYL